MELVNHIGRYNLGKVIEYLDDVDRDSFVMSPETPIERDYLKRLNSETTLHKRIGTHREIYSHAKTSRYTRFNIEFLVVDIDVSGSVHILETLMKTPGLWERVPDKFIIQFDSCFRYFFNDFAERIAKVIPPGSSIYLFWDDMPLITQDDVLMAFLTQRKDLEYYLDLRAVDFEELESLMSEEGHSTIQIHFHGATVDVLDNLPPSYPSRHKFVILEECLHDFYDSSTDFEDYEDAYMLRFL
jgi:hypothetical protein